MRAYVINLARSPRRRAHIEAELDASGLDYEIVPGVDWRDMDETDLHDPGTVAPAIHAEDWFRPGVAACALSHLNVYRKILADGLEQALVLEDDVTLAADLVSVTDAVAGHLTGAEVALLNYDSDGTYKMSMEGSVPAGSSRVLALPIDVGQSKSGAGYIITREACKRMRDSVLPVRARADDWGVFYREGALDRVRCVFPQPVAKSPDFESTIDYNAPGSVKGRLIGLAMRHNVPVLRQAIAYRRQRIWRNSGFPVLVREPFIEKPSRL